MSEGTYKACLEWPQGKRSLHPPARILDIYIEAFPGFSHGGSQQETISRLHPCKRFPLWDRWAEHTLWGRRGHERPLIAWVWLTDQPVVMSSGLPPPQKNMVLLRLLTV